MVMRLALLIQVKFALLTLNLNLNPLKAVSFSMGNQTSNQSEQSTLALQKLLRPNKHFSNQYIRNLPYPLLIQLIQDLKIDTNPGLSNSNTLTSQYSLNSMAFTDDFSFNKISHRLTWRTASQHPHIFNIKNIKIESHKNLCASTQIIYLSQDGYQFTLKDLIHSKIYQKSSFTEEQILILLTKITQAIVWMHDNQFKNIPLDSQSIFFIQDSLGQSLQFQQKISHYTCKIIDQDLVQTNSYKNFLQSLAESRHQTQNRTRKPLLQIYLSPQLLEQAKMDNFYPTNLSLKSDIFTIGMIMMELCCQEEMYFCYNLDNLTFDYESLIHRIAKISYSNELKLLLAEMLQYDEKNRIGFVSLKEKLGKLVVKPFQQTRKLKRRSSSTMLRELLSCSRASASVQSKEPTTQKQGFSRITSLSQSNKKIQQNPKVEDTSSKTVQANQSLRKSSSLVNLKCKTNSFLTSKKSTLMRVNSSTKLQTDSRKFNDVSYETNKVDYKNILKKRLKAESRVLQCPQGEMTNLSFSESALKVVNNYPVIASNSKLTETNHNPTQQQITTGKQTHSQQQIQNKKSQKDQQSTIQQKQTLQSLQTLPIFAKKSKEPSQFSYVQKKVIHLDQIHIFSSLSKNKLKNTTINQQQISYKGKSTKENQNNHTLAKQPKSSTKIAKKQTILSLQKTEIIKPVTQDVKKPKIHSDNSKIEDSSFGHSNKNWIKGKLKSDKNTSKKVDFSISNLILVNKDKTLSNKKQSLTKQKSIQLINPITQSFRDNHKAERISEVKVVNGVQNTTKHLPFSLNKDQNGQTQRDQLDLKQFSQWNKNDTIIKRLDLTEEKQPAAQSGFEQKQSKINGNIKDQMELINRVLQNCQLSSSRWQQESQKFDFKGYETEKNINLQTLSHSQALLPISRENQTQEQIVGGRQKVESQNEEVSKFRKKNKVIDIGLGTFPYQNDNYQLSNPTIEESGKTKQLLKAERKPCSKLQKLKQLTIFTEQGLPENACPSSILSSMSIINTGEDKENNMLNSNLPYCLSILAPNNESNLGSSMDKFKKSVQAEFLHQNHQINKYNPIPKIQLINLAVTNQSLITPHNLNDLNRFYGKGLTLQSEQHSLASTLIKKDFSTLSKPFQQIQLNYTDTTPLISSPNFPKNHCQDNQQIIQPSVKSLPKESIQFHQKSFQNSSTKKDHCLYSINAQELTFRLKPKVSHLEKEEKTKNTAPEKYHKINFFEKQDGSFLMREQNPIKSIQTSSIIGRDKSTVGQRNTVEQLFKESQKFENKGLKESFYERNEDNSENMNSSCDSINLSEIEYQGQQSVSFIYPEALNENQRVRKYKHISILESGDQSFDNPKKVNLNLKNLKQITQKDQSKNHQTNRNSEYDTYRGYLSSNKSTSTIKLADNFVYEGQINKYGEFEGNGMISRKNLQTRENDLIYTGSFLNGMYHGFGTLYEIENPDQKILKLPSNGKRMSFGEQRMQKKSQKKLDKYFLLSGKPIKYEGEFLKGQQNGFGTYTYENGDRYCGCIKHGTAEGYGTYHFIESGESISGIWRHNSYSEC